MAAMYDGAIVAVTGASTGLGRAIAVGVAAAGARAVLINFNSSAAEAAHTADLVRAAGAEAIGNVALDEDCRSIADAALTFGQLDALFNNAGISRSPTDGDLGALSGEDFLDIYRVNVVGPYQMVRAARPLLESAPAAAVVNTSSVAGVTGIGSSIAYSAAKGALNTMTKALALALAPKVRVNAICPGFIDSPWFDKIAPAGGVVRLREQIRRTTPLRAASTPQEVAESALFLGSRASRPITGELLLVDAGLHLGGAPS
jgi:3-oxoacyl-[acyl-carrier protein] reductase